MYVPEFFTFVKAGCNIARMLITTRDMPPVWLR